MKKPLSILILGGTGFVGPHQVRYALDRGHQITLFNRGRRPKEWPSHVEELSGDRDKNDYEALKGRHWDVCIDNPTAVPHWVRDAAAVLKDNVGQYIFVSTISVYASNAKIGADEKAARATFPCRDAMAVTSEQVRQNIALYGPLKALCEDEALRHFPGRATIVRPGLIVGPSDETDRFTYWPVRIARGGPMLVPPLIDPVQFVDVRDLSEWMIRLAENRTTGVFIGVGPQNPLSMGTFLDTIKAAINPSAYFREVSRAFLEKHNVNGWSDLPVWLSGTGETAGFHRRSNARAVAAGLTFRPLAATATETLAWFEQQPAERRAMLRNGLNPQREAELIKMAESQ